MADWSGVKDFQAGAVAPSSDMDTYLSANTQFLYDVLATVLIPNLLINGGFDFWQRQVPGTLTTVADDAYMADMWYALTQTGTIQAARTTGDISQYACQLKQTQASAQRLGVAQIVEHSDSKPMRGRTMRFRFRAKGSTTLTMRFAILEWTGTADTVTSDVVNDWTSASYTAGGFFLGSNLTVVAVGSQSITTSFTTCEATGTISTSCNNLIVIAWTESTAAQNVTVDICEAQLKPSNASFSWVPRPIVQELMLCQGFCEKSYDFDQAPGANTAVGRSIFALNALGTDTAWILVTFAVRKRRVPTVAYWDIVGNASKISEVTTGGGHNSNVTPSFGIFDTNTRAFDMIHNPPASSINGIELQWLATCNL